MESTQPNRGDFLKQHFRGIMKYAPGPPPWPKMMLCGVATTVPLVIGLLNGQLILSIYGALAGYLLGLSDDQGPLLYRLWTITVTFLLLIAGFSVGHVLAANSIGYLVIFTCLAYWLGVMAGQGAALERALLFTAVSLVAANTSPPIPHAAIMGILFFVWLGFGCVIVGVLLLAALIRDAPEPIVKFSTSLKESLNLKKKNHIHAACYAAAALVAIGVTRHIHIERSNWVIVTVLLVMKPDNNPAFYRVIQRFVGTILGVSFVDILLQINNDPIWFIPLIIASAVCVPWAIKKNYWIVTFLATTMVVLLLEITNPHKGNLHTPFIRFVATVIGCVIGALGLVCSRLLDSVLADGREKSFTE